jgi:hypothetical protein
MRCDIHVHSYYSGFVNQPVQSIWDGTVNLLPTTSTLPRREGEWISSRCPITKPLKVRASSTEGLTSSSGKRSLPHGGNREGASGLSIEVSVTKATEASRRIMASRRALFAIRAPDSRTAFAPAGGSVRVRFR